MELTGKCSEAVAVGTNSFVEKIKLFLAGVGPGQIADITTEAVRTCAK